MSNSNHRAPQNGAALFLTLALSLLVVGTGTYCFLFRDSGGAAEPSAGSGSYASAPLSPEDSSAIHPTSLPEAPTEEEAPEPETEAPAPAAAVVPMPELPVADDTPVVAAAPSLVVSPLNGEVIAAFSVDALTYNSTLEDWRVHDGVDIAAPAGTEVLAAASGTVQEVRQDDLLGTTVVLRHAGDEQTTYANLQSKPPVKKGDAVTAGQVIGAVGATALAESAEEPHLHFSVSRDGDAVDPETYLKK